MIKVNLIWLKAYHFGNLIMNWKEIDIINCNEFIGLPKYVFRQNFKMWKNKQIFQLTWELFSHDPITKPIRLLLRPINATKGSLVQIRAISVKNLLWNFTSGARRSTIFGPHQLETQDFDRHICGAVESNPPTILAWLSLTCRHLHFTLESKSTSWKQQNVYNFEAIALDWDFVLFVSGMN